MTLTQQSPYLRVQRSFPIDDIKPLSGEVDRAYIDIASKVNLRTIGIFSVSTPSVTGESWYLTGSSVRQQSLRQVYAFSDSNLTIAHGINFATVSFFKPVLGEFFDGTNYQNLPYVDVTAANNQIMVAVTPTNIVITKGGGAPPTIVSGYVIVEWVSQF